MIKILILKTKFWDYDVAKNSLLKSSKIVKCRNISIGICFQTFSVITIENV